MSFDVAADAAHPALSPAPVPHAAATALLPAPAAFASIQHEFLMSLAPHKRPKALIDAPTYAAVRAVLRDGDLAPRSAFCTWAHNTFRLDDDVAYILHENKRVARAEDLHAILCAAHTACGHGGCDATHKEVLEHWRFVPKDLVARFVRGCPTCIMKRTPDMQRSARERLSVPRVLISPVVGSPPAELPGHHDLAVPLGSPTIELLMGFASPRQAMEVAPARGSPAPSAGTAAPRPSAIPLDPALSLYPAPPPPTVALSITMSPPPRPPRSPLRPTPKRLSPTSRTTPPLPINVHAANSCTSRFCDVDTSTPPLSSAYNSNASDASPPSTPLADARSSFVRSLSGKSLAVPKGGVLLRKSSDSTEYTTCDEGIRQDTFSPVSPPVTLRPSTNAAEVPPTPPSAASVWSQDSANSLCNYRRSFWCEARTGRGRDLNQDAYDGDAELEEED